MNSRNSMDPRESFTLSRILCYLLFALLGYAAWARGGIYPPLQWPMVTLSVLILGCTVFLEPEQRKELRKALLHDPVFYIGALFLLLLLVQSVNSNYMVVWDEVNTVWMERVPSKWLPWSVEPLTASEMLNWFFPAWTAILAVRHVLDRSDVLLLLYLLVWNATLLAFVGMVQHVAGASKMLGLWEIPGNNFFATFGYINHAGAWFYLHAALAAGLAHHAIRRKLPTIQVLVWCFCFLICLMASFFTLSRAAALAATLLVGVVFVLLLAWGWRHNKSQQMVNAIGTACVMLLLGAVLYFSAGGGALANEIDKTFLGDGLEKAVTSRIMQQPSAWGISKDYPMFGCGGWGYRWVALVHIPVDQWSHFRSPGQANVHCDPLQFLVEFGGIGAALMTAIIAVLVFGAVRHRNSRVLWNWIAVGLLLVFLHSWIDLPFRCPAILIAWCVLLTAMARLPARRKHEWYAHLSDQE